jgi:nucleoid-associated protein YgaU
MLKPSKELLTRKLGPMPTWAWMLIGIGLAVIWKSIQASRANDQAKADETPTGDPELIGGDQSPPVVFQNFTTFTGSPWSPPSRGRTSPPVAPPPPGPVNPLPPAGPGTQPTGHWVTVAKFTTHNPPWNSTLSGIAKHLKGNQNAWQAIWNAPQNAAEKARRKDPKHIQPGDRIFVPA